MLECTRGFRLDPASQQINAAKLLLLVNTHHWPEALDQYTSMAELYPDLASVHATGGLILTALGRDAEALDAFLRGDRLAGKSPDQIGALLQSGKSYGLRGYWRERLRQSANVAAHSRVPPVEFAQTHVQLGDKDAAIGFLEAAYKEHAPRLAWLKASAIWDPLRDDARFQSLLSKMGFPE
jgi:hypothetical protein